MAAAKESSETGYWLPENYVLKLTAIEAGALATMVHSSDRGTFTINKPDQTGNR